MLPGWANFFYRAVPLTMCRTLSGMLDGVFGLGLNIPFLNGDSDVLPRQCQKVRTLVLKDCAEPTCILLS